MDIHGATINRFTIAFQLNEAIESIHSAISSLKCDDGVDPAIWVSLADILGHLCLAWNRKWQGPDEVSREGQEEYELKSDSVPNWGGRFRLVTFETSHPAIFSQSSRTTIDRETVVNYLRAAEGALQDLMHDVLAGKFEPCNIAMLGGEFGAILHKLCLAWHLRYLNDAEISSLDPTVAEELGCWIPRWQWNLRLVPP